MRISKNLSSGKTLYHFSEDLRSGCRYYAKLAAALDSGFDTTMASTSAILMAASFVEARLNELSAEMVSNDGNPRAPAAFWRVVHDRRKDLNFKDKWNLVASVSGGHAWDGAREPFQSYDLIVTLRNELVHYKGEYGDGEAPPVRSIRSLLAKFNDGDVLAEPFDETLGQQWVVRLLSATGLTGWIADTVDEFDKHFDHLLTGREFTEQDRLLYELRTGGSGLPTLPMTKRDPRRDAGAKSGDSTKRVQPEREE